MAIEALKKNYLFQRAYRSRKNYVSPVLITYVVEKKTGGFRLGITTGKKVGNAVERNHARRLVRAATADLLKDVKKRVDVVVVCRHGILNMKSTQVEEILRKHLESAGVI